MTLHMKRNPGLLLVFLGMFLFSDPSAIAQVFGGSQRPFVTSITPVIGPNGVVGGVSIDADGLVSRTQIDTSGQLFDGQVRPTGAVATHPAHQPGKLRKISLRMLEQELVRLQEARLPVNSEIEYLAGLQRIEYVFVDQKNNDIILAGPAEGWRFGRNGFVVGERSGLPVIDLCDLVMMMRRGEEESNSAITCSIDATAQGMANYSTYMSRANRQFNEQTLREMSDAIGNFEVTFSGVANDSHYARILIAADVMMKRLAMNIEPFPVRGVTSYVQMLQKSGNRNPNNVSPRWWLASDYETLLRDEGGMAWKICGPAVKTMTSDDYLNQKGERIDSRKTNRLAQRWADDFTKQYGELSVELPIFGQLRNCMDLAIVGALLHKYDLFEKAGFQPTALMDNGQIKLAEYPVPRFTQPQISYAPRRRDWVVTLSGGVEVDGWSFASITQADADLQAIHTQVVESSGDTWWWD